MLRSAIVVPSSRLAVPSRLVIRPGWDDLPIDRPRRRSAWWQRLLSGAAAITRFQPGSCCGCSSGTGITCGSYAVPTALTLTDAVGSISLNHITGGFLDTWIGCQIVTVSSSTATTPGGVCTVAAPATQAIAVCYQMQCDPTVTPHLTLTRTWSYVFAPGPPIAAVYYCQSATAPCTAAGMPTACSTTPPAICGSPNTDKSVGSADPTSTSPFAVTFTMTPNGGNTMSDPIGGSVAVSA